MSGVRYRVTLPHTAGLDLRSLADQFLARTTHPYRREKQGKVQDFDLRQELISLEADDTSLDMVIARGKPLEFAAAIVASPLEALAAARIEKLEVFFRQDG